MISVIIPVYNERESVRTLHDRLLNVLKKIGQPFEAIFIDDGSTDGTAAVLSAISPATVIIFSRNFGKSQALQAGFDYAKGDIIFTMDGDLQDEPEEIPRFLEKLNEGHDVVCGWKKDRHDPFSRRLASRIANTVARFATGLAIHDMNCCFKAYRKEAAKSLALHGDLHRYIPALLYAEGYGIDEIVVRHKARAYGKSKYGITRLVTSSFDFITLLFLRTFIDRPLHFFGAVGVFFSAIGVMSLAYLSWIKFAYGASIGSRPLLLFGALLIIVGFQIFTLGLMGDLIIRRTAHNSPPRYHIRSVTEKK